jgi:endonuclease YncB( thermonuclease family)
VSVIVGALLASGKPVMLEADVQKRDRLGRLVACIRLPDGQMMALQLVDEGYSMPITIPTNLPYAEQFVTVAGVAQKNRGLWVGWVRTGCRDQVDHRRRGSAGRTKVSTSPAAGRPAASQ